MTRRAEANEIKLSHRKTSVSLASPARDLDWEPMSATARWRVRLPQDDPSAGRAVAPPLTEAELRILRQVTRCSPSASDAGSAEPPSVPEARHGGTFQSASPRDADQSESREGAPQQAGGSQRVRKISTVCHSLWWWLRIIWRLLRAHLCALISLRGTCHKRERTVLRLSRARTMITGMPLASGRPNTVAIARSRHVTERRCKFCCYHPDL